MPLRSPGWSAAASMSPTAFSAACCIRESTLANTRSPPFITVDEPYRAINCSRTRSTQYDSVSPLSAVVSARAQRAPPALPGVARC